MKRFANLKSLETGEILTYVSPNTRHNVAGVTSAPISVYAMGEGMDDGVLFAFYPAGEFQFDIGHDRPFSIWFEKHGDGVLSIYRHPSALEIKYDPDDTWTSVEHRPAINPEMAAIQRQLRSLQLQVQQSEANRRATIKRPQVQAPVQQVPAKAETSAPVQDTAPAPGKPDGAANEG